MKLTAKHKAILASYGRSFLASALAATSIGGWDLKAMLVAGLSAVVPVAIRALNPNDIAFGLIADHAKIELDKLAKPTKKKAAAKKK
jgi:hypothetical protein